MTGCNAQTNKKVSITGPQKAKVLTILSVPSYSYLETQNQQGQKVWLLMPASKIPLPAGTEIEYMSSSPVTGYQCKSLNRTFDKLIPVPSIKIL
jgi:hypothetical protein